MGACRCLVHLAAVWTLFLLVITFMPGLPPNAPYDVLDMQPPKQDGPLIPNTVLDGAKRLFQGRVMGPEGLASRGPNELFMSTSGGHIMKVSGKNMDKLEKVVTIGTPCDKYWEESKCGRPLGIRFGKDGKLLVADAYLGVFKVDVDTGEKKRLFDHRLLLNGSASRLLNDVIEDQDGNIYWSVSSTITDLSVIMLEGLSGPTGRVVKYDPKTGENTILIDKILVSNGIELSPDESFLLISETWQSRVLRYWLKGPKKGTHDVFVSGLPGLPDNIRARPQGGYDLPMVGVKDPERLDVNAVLNRLPWLRRLIARLLVGFKKTMDAISNLHPSLEVAAKVAFDICSSVAPLKDMTGDRAMIVQLDNSGKIVSKMTGSSGTVELISEVIYVGDNMYIGSCCVDYLGVISKAEIQKRMKESPSSKQKGKEEL